MRFQNLVTSLKWKEATFIGGTTMGADSSPEALSGRPSISAQFSKSMRLSLKRKFLMPYWTFPSST